MNKNIPEYLKLIIIIITPPRDHLAVVGGLTGWRHYQGQHI
jgi:hypothetical protein